MASKTRICHLSAYPHTLSCEPPGAAYFGHIPKHKLGLFLKQTQQGWAGIALGKKTLDHLVSGICFLGYLLRNHEKARRLRLQERLQNDRRFPGYSLLIKFEKALSPDSTPLDKSKGAVRMMSIIVR